MAGSIALQAAPAWNRLLKQPTEWYGSEEALEVSRAIIAHQDEASGGWPKNTDMTIAPSAEFLARSPRDRAPTIDNGATTTQVRLLARVAQASGQATIHASVRRGLRYLLDAQYQNGGWPQFYPLRAGYYSHITYNDNAMVNVLEVLSAVAAGQEEWAPFAAEFGPDADRAVARGVACILATQVVVDEQLTVWCAQHDATTLAPAPARSYEPVSLSGMESARIVRFLMQVPEPTPAMVSSVEAAMRWFAAVAIPGKRVDRSEGDQRLVDDPPSDAWARFYEIGTNRPIFLGRDAVVRYDLAEVEAERRGGYSYYGDYAEELFTDDYPAWLRRLARQSQRPVLFIAGDSTAADKPRLTHPERGWGQALRHLIKDGWHLDNRAVNGRSTKSFIDEGRWAALINDLKAGDWVIIQFGHNDEKSSDPSRHTIPYGSYRDNLRRFVDDVRAKGGHPVLATPVARRKWNEAGTELVPTHGDYPAAVRDLAAAESVPLLELEQRTADLELSLGVAGSKALHLWHEAGALATRPEGLADDAHYSPLGARRVAWLVLAEMRRLELPIADAFPVVPDAVVARDGTGDYTSIEAAIYGAPQARAEPGPGDRWVVLVKSGTYRERVYVQRERGNIALIGEDPATTILVEGMHANLSGPDGKKLGTFRTATLQVDGDGFIVENLTIANDAGPVGQALALRVDGDRVVFRQCRFLGWQDTVLVNRGRHYFADCHVEGHVDFIFGAANAVFERTHLHCVGNGYITAASTPFDQAHGLTFLDCSITGEPDVRTYLGRPWRAYARTTFVRTVMSEVVRAEGWHNWNQAEREHTSRYVEIDSSGPGGAGRQDRVTWARTLRHHAGPPPTAAGVLRGDDGWEIPLPLAR